MTYRFTEGAPSDEFLRNLPLSGNFGVDLRMSKSLAKGVYLPIWVPI